MPFEQGDRYKCPHLKCDCEIEVTKSAAPGCGGNESVRCCCGKEMVPVENKK